MNNLIVIVLALALVLLGVVGIILIRKEKYTCVPQLMSLPSKPYSVVAFSGGGMRAMTQDVGYMMGLVYARQRSIEDLLRNVPIISGNSGGTWFLSLLLYSNMFQGWLEEARQGGNPASIFERYYTRELRAIWENRIQSPFIKYLMKLNLFNDFVTLFGSYAQFLGKPWLDTMENFIFYPVPDIHGVKYESSPTLVSKGKLVIMFGCLLTEALVGVNEDRTTISYKFSNDPYCEKNCGLGVPIVFGANLDETSNLKIPLFMSRTPTTIPMQYEGRKGLKKIVLPVNLSMSIPLGEVTVEEVSGTSSAAMGMTTSITAIQNILVNLTGSKVNKMEWIFLSELVTLIVHNLSMNLDFYPNAEDVQGCKSSVECSVDLGGCKCTDLQNCPDGLFQPRGSKPNNSCCFSFTKGCECASPSPNEYIDGVIGKRNQASGGFKKDFEDQVTVNLARLRTSMRAADGGNLDNTAIVAGIHAHQLKNGVNTPCKLLAFCCGSDTNLTVDGPIVLGPQLGILFGYTLGGKRVDIDPNQEGIDILDIQTTDTVKRLVGAIYVASPQIFKREEGIPDRMWPDGSGWMKDGNSFVKILHYPRVVTQKNVWYGIEEGTPVEITAVMLTTLHADDVPFHIKDYAILNQTVGEIATLVRKYPELNQIF